MPPAESQGPDHESDVTARTGLILDPYFSGTKIAWILDHVAGSRAAAEKGALAAGTIECFLLWRLTGGKVHVTKLAPTLPKENLLVMNLCGRGDKDVFAVAERLGMKI